MIILLSNAIYSNSKLILIIFVLHPYLHLSSLISLVLLSKEMKSLLKVPTILPWEKMENWLIGKNSNLIVNLVIFIEDHVLYPLTTID